MNYLSKLSPPAAEVCKSLHNLTLTKTDWTWNTLYQKLYDQAKALIKKDIFMKFYNARKSLYLPTDATGIGLGAGLLLVRYGMNCARNVTPDNLILRPIAFTSRSPTCIQRHYSSIERKEL